MENGGRFRPKKKVAVRPVLTRPSPVLVSKTAGKRPAPDGRPFPAALRWSGGSKGAAVPHPALLVHNYLPTPTLLAAEGSVPSATIHPAK